MGSASDKVSRVEAHQDALSMARLRRMGGPAAFIIDETQAVAGDDGEGSHSLRVERG
jgi:hypothetical protein